jgi:hypothetical protein
MSTETHEDRELVAELSKLVVQEIAPEELMFFDEILQDYFSNPNALKETSSKNPLAFGVDDIFIAMTPAIIASISALAEFVKLEVVRNAQERSASAIKKILKELIARKDKDAQPLFTIEQFEVIKSIVDDQARLFRLNPKQARLLSESIVGNLALKSKAPSRK